MGPEEFQRALITVLIAGSIIMGVGATAVFLMLRGFGKRNAGGRSHIAIVAGMLAFILLCCVMLFLLAYHEA